MQEIKEKHNSGFNDYSIYSEEETKRKSKNISNFLIKSHNTDSFNNNNNDSNSIKDNRQSKVSNITDKSNNGNKIEDNNIIVRDSKNSINSEDEDNLKIKYIFIGSNEGNNELNTNLINPSDENLIFSVKNKLSHLSTTDDILRDTIKISMNRINKFNTSKLARIFTYEENGKNNNYILKSKKFGMTRNNNIITYILNLYIFSEFTNFNKVEKDSRVKLYFLPISYNRFDPNVEEDFLNKLKIENNKSDQFIAFINGLNTLLNDKEYNEIQKANKKYSTCLYISIILLFLFILGIVFYFFDSFGLLKDFNINFVNSIISDTIIKYIINISAGIIGIILIILLILQLIKLRNKNLYIIYNNLNYMLINYARFNNYIEEWNKTFFEEKKIRVSIPISLKYIMFNLDPYQDIEIKHLDMKWFIEIVYKDKKSIVNDKDFIKYFIKVRSTLVEGNNTESI